jgi:hypothetical protein
MILRARCRAKPAPVPLLAELTIGGLRRWAQMRDLTATVSVRNAGLMRRRPYVYAAGMGLSCTATSAAPPKRLPRCGQTGTTGPLGVCS